MYQNEIHPLLLLLAPCPHHHEAIDNAKKKSDDDDARGYIYIYYYLKVYTHLFSFLSFSLSCFYLSTAFAIKYSPFSHVAVYI